MCGVWAQAHSFIALLFFILQSPPFTYITMRMNCNTAVKVRPVRLVWTMTMQSRSINRLLGTWTGAWEWLP
ncbi:hypothetical protein QBC41DRAFT_331442 [Cercophora samala]|uniref:Uncharacterized protein n=1 Tax=Cercophora samala TaxID=330535 RepID=A0AA39YVQ9_9PEZI|nr:hypothetical protein QBC41DRAFT_331442 [Cercophora samala]